MIPQWFMDTAGQVAMLFCGLALVTLACMCIGLLVHSLWEIIRG